LREREEGIAVGVEDEAGLDHLVDGVPVLLFVGFPARIASGEPGWIERPRAAAQPADPIRIRARDS
jgi:hypothetical protein